MKQMKTNRVKPFLLVLVTASVLVSCQKDKNETDGNNTEAAQLVTANAEAETLYDDTYDVIMQDGEANNVAGRTSSCATVTITPLDPGAFPKTMTIDFGAGCISANGISRKGKIIATLTGKLRTSGTVISVSYENYYVNNYKLEGTYSISNNGGAGLNFTTQVTAGKIIYPDGATYYNYTGTHTLAQTAGAGTPTFTDDNFSMTGNASTSSSAGNSVATNISTALVKNAACRNIVSGVVQFIYNTSSGSLNYGDGSCDNLAILTVGPLVQTVTLPR